MPPMSIGSDTGAADYGGVADKEGAGQSQAVGRSGSCALACYKRSSSAGADAMPRLLSEAQIARYRDEGYLAPIRIMDEEAALALRVDLEAVEARMGGPLRGDLRHKSHLLFPFLADLVRHDLLLDAIEDVLGPDLLCWTSNFFIKEAANPAFVSWHQDSTYWGLSAPEVATAWVALTPSTLENGAVAVIPGSHKSD